MYSKEEMKVLNKVAKDFYGCKFNDLDFEEQDEILLLRRRQRPAELRRDER